MDNELDLLLGTAIDSLVKLEIILLFHARPGTVSRPEDMAGRFRRPQAEVVLALDQLAEAGLIERFVLGSGRHAVYGPSDDDRVGAVIEVLNERYNRNSDTRAEVVRSALRVSAPDPGPIGDR
jgi:predicted transcriptional regulator